MNNIKKELADKVTYYKKREEDKDSKIRDLELKLDKAKDDKKTAIRKVESVKDDYKRRFDETKEKLDNRNKDMDELKDKLDKTEGDCRKLKVTLADVEEKNKKIEDLTEENKNQAHVITFKDGKITDLEKG